MITYTSLPEAEEDKARWRAPVVVVGFFDGLHRGHQKLLDDARAWAAEVGGEPFVVTFDRHPQAFLSGTGPPAVLSLRHRLRLLERCGIAAALVLSFDEALSRLSPEGFVEEVLMRSLGSRHLLLGFDSAVGHRRQGTFEYLSARADKLGIDVQQSAPLIVDGQRVSSTLVREAVLSGDLAALERITGRRWSILGQVVTGDGRGRQIGYPTANLRVEVDAVLPGGVYFAEVDLLRPHGEGESAAPGELEWRPALVNIGRRPTFTGATAAEGALFYPDLDRIEVHILDHEGDLLGEFLEVRFLRRHRGERRFAGADELVAQIRRDEDAFRAYLQSAVETGDLREPSQPHAVDFRRPDLV